MQPIEFHATVRNGFPVIVRILDHRPGHDGFPDEPPEAEGFEFAVRTESGRAADFLRLTASELDDLEKQCHDEVEARADAMNCRDIIPVFPHQDNR